MGYLHTITYHPKYLSMACSVENGDERETLNGTILVYFRLYVLIVNISKPIHCTNLYMLFTISNERLTISNERFTNMINEV